MSLEDADALKNASAIIERFGGIRPMAAKVGAPVTTVQGWKKRDVIPGSRRDDILKAANENQIDLSDILTGDYQGAGGTVAAFPAPPKPPAGSPFAIGIPSNDDAGGEIGVASQDQGPVSQPFAGNPRKDELKISVEPLPRAGLNALPQSITPRIDATHEELMAAIESGRRKAVRTSLWTTLLFVALVASAAAVALWPSAQKIQRHDSEIASLESKVGTMDKDVQAMNDSAGEIKDMVPDDMRQKLAALREQADGIGNDVEKAARQAQAMAQSVTSGDAGSLSDRLSVVEAKINDVQNGEGFKDLVARVKNLEVSLSGQQQISDSVAELSRIVDSMDGRISGLGNELADAKKNPTGALGQTLQGVNDQDLKAAAMLIAFAQLRESLNRNTPFSEDVALLQKLVGDQNPELQDSLARLAPQAEKGGVLTSEGLSQEFKGLAGDIVFSSLKGEDVSVTEKAKVRFTQAMNLKKDGELVGGTPTQKAVSKAQQQLNNNDVEGAIATLKTLDGPAQAQAAPFIEQAQATLLADRVQGMLRKMIVGSVGTGAITAPGGGNAMQTMTTKIQSALPGGSGMVRDDKSGFVILPQPKGFKGFSTTPSE